MKIMVLPGLLIVLSVAAVLVGRWAHRARTASREAHEQIEAAQAATRRLARRYEMLIKENRTKNEFVANMSHELRTPLNIILGYTDMLRDESSRLESEESDRLLTRVRTAASNLLHLVDMVLDLGKLEAGKIPVHRTRLALGPFVEGLAERERIPLADGVSLHWQAHVGLPVIETDPDKLTIVLDNLISNAIKFTDEGTIAVRIASDPAHAVVHFEIEDTGPGIEPQSLETIFKPFQQLERSCDNPFGGVGLGLAIVYSYVRLLGGTISVRSTVEVGTCFHLILPVRREAGAASEPTHAPTAPES